MTETRKSVGLSRDSEFGLKGNFKHIIGVDEAGEMYTKVTYIRFGGLYGIF